MAGDTSMHHAGGEPLLVDNTCLHTLANMLVPNCETAGQQEARSRYSCRCLIATTLPSNAYIEAAVLCLLLAAEVYLCWWLPWPSVHLLQ